MTTGDQVLTDVQDVEMMSDTDASKDLVAGRIRWQKEHPKPWYLQRQKSINSRKEVGNASRD